MGYGLFAYGKSGETTIELYERADRNVLYELTITVSSASQTLAPSVSPAILSELKRFLETDDLEVLGLSSRGRVMTSIQKDSEFEDRAFLITNLKNEERHIFRMTLNVTHLIGALNQALEEL